MTPDQRELARHALGLPNDRRRSYRNRFFVNSRGVRAQPGTYGAWMDLVASGDAMHEPAAPGKSLDLFWLTRTGAEKVLGKGERLDLEDFPND
ncbi:hypothetical protein [Chelatococcus reniformis]|uniref:Uncharacterized protein n=1 Tax=Chelatococcus reniformis TaxID=1494448 RepID=A0A916UVM9_9HYPH|nr:hypothetical protein [Chelatococcus reniformis]GGC90765.1 hypothetical protein GCM10010994_55710 [Chelatococcus reniformis]